MELFGIRIRMHPSFLWLLLFLALLTGLETVGWIALVFVFVVLHEVSHCLVAKAHGIPVHDITLLPIGGVARLGGMPEDPQAEFRIAVAGPLLNVVVAAAAYALVSVLSRNGAPPALVLLFSMILIINVYMALFNLLPAFPMDGGRVLRAYLTTKLGYLEATRVAARVGRWIAGAMAVAALAGLIGGGIPAGTCVMLLLVSGFVYVSGKLEEAAVVVRHAEGQFWRLFGFGEPAQRGGAQAGPERVERGEPDPRRPRGDVVDVEGRVRKEGDDDGSAASAFRALAEEIDAHLKE